jgi:hypothetical protein
MTYGERTDITDERCHCRDDDHDPEFCCNCGHFHPVGTPHPDGPCGNYLCCQP